MRYKVVCLCGSMRFFDWMIKVAEQETLAGNIVLMPFVRKNEAMAAGLIEHENNVAEFLDQMHRTKIDMAEEIVVCTNGISYIGDSTRAEIQYTTDQGKNIRFAKDPSTPTPGEDPDDYK